MIDKKVNNSMNINNYAKAYKEVLEIIKYFPEEEYNKIPKEKIDFYKANMDNYYDFVIDPSIDLSKQNISTEANAIIVNLFLDYFATEEQKIKINEILDLNEQKAELKKREQYNPDNIFKSNNSNIDEIQKNEQETALVEAKENFFVKFKNFIYRILHLNK